MIDSIGSLLNRLILCLLCLFLLVFVISAQENNLAISLSGEKNLKLDEQTAYPGVFGSSFQYCKDRDAIAYLNQITKTIVYFDYQSGETIGKTQLAIVGPDGVGGEPYYTHYHNKDSIFVISRFNKFRLSLVNSEGKKVNAFDYDVMEEATPISARIFGGIVVQSSFVYLSFQIPANAKVQQVAPVARINMKSKEVELLEKPLAYQGLDMDRIVGSNQYEFYETRIAFNRNKNELVLSYPLEHFVHRISNSTVLKSPVKGELLGEFRFLPKNRNAYRKESRESREMIQGSAWYFGILYDPYRNVYYRIGKAAADIKKVRARLAGQEIKIPYEYVIMVLDDDLRLIDELKISTRQAIVHRGVFVGPDGLHIAQLNLRGEDIMGFSTFTLSDDQEE